MYHSRALTDVTKCGVYRLLAEQAERSIEDQQYKLTNKEADLRSRECDMLAMEERLAENNTARQLDREEMISLKSVIASLDREKDQLQATVDEKTENIVLLEDDIMAKVTGFVNLVYFRLV